MSFGEGVGLIRRFLVFKYFEYICCLCGVVFLLLSLRKDWLRGGNGWKQGDWLINSNINFVRRGGLGSAFLWVSDVMSLDPLGVVIAVQAIIFIASVFLLVLLVSKVAYKRYFLFLLFSPSFCLMFWVGDPQGGFRKEIILYLAMLLVGLGVSWRKKSAIYFSVLVAGVGCFGHEINCLLLPAFCFCIFFAFGDGIIDRFDALLMSMVGVVVASVLGVQYFAFGYYANPESVCLPLLDRGLDKHLCDGAISWIGKTSASGRGAVSNMHQNASIGNVVGFVFSYVVSSLFFVKFVRFFDKERALFLVYFCCFVPMVPLYFVAVDWGRWMSAHVTSATLCLLCLFLSKNRPILRKNVSDPVSLKPYFLLSLFFLPNHSLNIQSPKLALFCFLLLGVLVLVEIFCRFLREELKRLA